MNGWRYVLTPRGEREIRRLDESTRKRVLEALDRFVADPDSGHVRKLQGREDEWRLRVGAVRVRFRRDNDARAIVVVRVLPRGRAYRS